jgi:TonB family protein
MSPRKRNPDRFFGSSSGASAEPQREPGSLEIVDGEGEPRGRRTEPSRSNAQGGRGASGPHGPEPEDVVPYMGNPQPRRSSFAWAWLTVMLTLMTVVASYWFYEGFDGDLELVRERFRTVSKRFVPEPRITPLPSAEPQEEIAAAIEIDPDAPLPVVTESNEIAEGEVAASEPDPVEVPAAADPEASDDGEPEPAVVSPDPLMTGVSMTGVPLSGPTPMPAATPLAQRPTTPRPTAPNRPPTAEEEATGWYRTEATIAPDSAAPSAEPSPRSAWPATSAPERSPQPEREELAALWEEAAPAAAGAPAVVLPTELTQFERPTPGSSPTPAPTPDRASVAGSMRITVGQLTAAASMMELGLANASRSLAAIHRNFTPPYAKQGVRSAVEFRVLRDGSVRDARLSRASGWEALDTAALRAVNRTGRIEPLGPEVPTESVRVEVFFDY